MVPAMVVLSRSLRRSPSGVASSPSQPSSPLAASALSWELLLQGPAGQGLLLVLDLELLDELKASQA